MKTLATASYRTKASWNIRRLLNFLKVFGRNRRGILGVAILLLFGAMAIVGPSLSPYDPTKIEPLAGSLAAPSWLRYFPGGEMLSETIDVVANPGFEMSDALEEWTFTTLPADQSIFIQHVSSMGDPYGSGPGCLAVTFKREEIGKNYGNVYFYLTKGFNFSYEGPPKWFEGYLSLTVEGTSELATEGATSMDAPVEINVFIETSEDEAKRYSLWSPDIGTIKNNLGSWITTKPSPEEPTSYINSYSGKLKKRMYGEDWAEHDPVKTIFNSSRLPANYIYGVEILFKDLSSPLKKVETTVYIDDFSLKVFGTSFGLLGTDQFGRDIFTQLLWGSRLSLYIGLLAAILGITIGLVIGLAAGYLGRIVDEGLMRFTDMLLVLPMLPLLIVIVAVLGATLNNLVLLLGLLGWMGFARLIRAQVLSIKERPFIEAAKAVGAGKVHIITRHVIPNVMTLVYVSLATSVPGIIVTEASLAWLGFYDPTVMSWGRMLFDVQNTSGAMKNWWWVVPPGLCIAVISLSFILLGYALDEILNPKLRVRR